MPLEPLRPHPIIRQIINRDVHCAASNISAVRHVIKKGFKQHKSPRAYFLSLKKHEKRHFIAGCALVQIENRSLYNDVNNGHFTEEPSNPYLFDTASKQVSIVSRK